MYSNSMSSLSANLQISFRNIIYPTNNSGEKKKQNMTIMNLWFYAQNKKNICFNKKIVIIYLLLVKFSS